MFRKNEEAESSFRNVELPCPRNVTCTCARLSREGDFQPGFALLALLVVMVIAVFLYFVVSSGLLNRNPPLQSNHPRQQMTEETLITQIRKVIESGGDINASQNNYSQTLMHIATKYGFMEAVVLCLDNGADIEAVDNPARMTPLHLAAYNGHVDVLKLLLDHGANTESRKILERTVLDSAIDAEANREEIVTMLLAAGANVDASDKHGSTALFWAIDEGQLSTAKILLDGGASTSARNVLGFTPLHEAIRHGQTEITELLIRYAADVNVRDNDGSTPLDKASGKVAELLRSHGAKKGSEL
jgi:ankyrin repeat protein